jgi:hypothetical protein
LDDSEFAANIDPNREHTKLVTQHSRDVKQLFSPFDSHISIDMHESAGHNEYSGRYRHGLDAMIGGGKNLNIHPMIRNLSENKFVANMGSLLESRGMRWGPYGSVTRAALGALRFSLRSCQPYLHLARTATV